MKLIKSFPEDMNKRQSFAMMTSDNTKRMIDLAGCAIVPDSWVLYEGLDQNDEPVEILTISADEELFSTISLVFIRKFKEIVDYFGSDVGEIAVTKGTSKNGRDFVSCDVSF